MSENLMGSGVMIGSGEEGNVQVSGIRTWRKFARKVRSRGCNLLKRLDDFPDSILITGCQRSGTTMLSRIITRSEGMVNYWFGRDDELAAALILAGVVEHTPRGRYCFQTTYLNECVGEYYQHDNGHRLVWVLRNPFSVVHSMLHNWKDFALNELFEACGSDLLDERDRRLYDWFGVWGVRRLKRACLAYCGKTSQIFELKRRLSNRVVVLDYDELVQRKQGILPELYRFLDLPYRSVYGEWIHGRSVDKRQSLSPREHAIVESTCLPVYEKAKKLVSWS
jgi:hypothetical protein